MYFHHYPPDLTNDIAPPDAGLGAQLKHYFGVYIEEWLCEDDQHIEPWESDKLPTWECRVLITHLLKKSWDTVCGKPNILEIYFEKTGCSMNATGERNERICLQKFKLDKYNMPDETEFTSQLVQPGGNLLEM